MTQREYRANIEGINIVFGAVLGFVLVGAEGLPVFDFVLMLVMSASIVVLILYLGSSEYKLFYAVLTAATIIALPFIAEDLFSLTRVPKLQPTLAIWALMVAGVELIPRTQSEPDSTQENTE
ncbi:hypothetical protein [uncultured Erythrobacter sp.]|uniref:hypothetical protein n=1 Tax=uncultured Erythrobacter sp. TaxID=263913 RepID=UPI00262DC52D|nr:hypothetical protein [uncultured Erythrobacter sp.]